MFADYHIEGMNPLYLSNVKVRRHFRETTDDSDIKTVTGSGIVPGSTSSIAASFNG